MLPKCVTYKNTWNETIYKLNIDISMLFSGIKKEEKSYIFRGEGRGNSHLPRGYSPAITATTTISTSITTTIINTIIIIIIIIIQLQRHFTFNQNALIINKSIITHKNQTKVYFSSYAIHK